MNKIHCDICDKIIHFATDKGHHLTHQLINYPRKPYDDYNEIDLCDRCYHNMIEKIKEKKEE